MTRNPLPSSMDHSDEEDYIEIEVSSCSYFSLCPNPNSSPQNREFDFQMASITKNKETTTSHADELFYGGKLLPLHQKFLQTEQPFEEEDSFCINLLITPIGSCNISPSQSCRVSFELNPNDHFFELTPSSCIVDHNSHKKLWSKLIKHSLISKKFKASREFFKSLFTKSSCCSNDMKVSKKTTPLRSDRKKINGLSSRSFTAAEFKWHSPIKFLSSSSTNSSSTGGDFPSSSRSFNSNNGYYELSFLKRRSSFTSDIEGSIEAAVAHCKKSQDITIPTIPQIAISHC